MVEQLFTIDDHVITCAGGLAGVDLMLKLIGDAHGEGLAGEVADQMLHSPVRPANASSRVHGHLSAGPNWPRLVAMPPAPQAT